MKHLLVLLLAFPAYAALPTFLVQCPAPTCPLGKQELRAKKIAVYGSTSTTNGAWVDRSITFKCKTCGKFIAKDRVFTPTPEPPIEIKRKP